MQGSWPDSLFCYPLKELGTARLLPTADRVCRASACSRLHQDLQNGYHNAHAEGNNTGTD